MFRQKVETVFSLLNYFSADELAVFFQKRKYIKLAFENHRKSLPHLLALLAKCEMNTIATQLVVDIENNTEQSFFLLLLNYGFVLSSDNGGEGNEPLSNESVLALQSLMNLMFKKVPIDFQQNLISCNEGENLFLKYHELGLSKEVGKSLVLALSPELIDKFFSNLPDSLESKHVPMLASFIDVATSNIAYRLLLKNITYSQKLIFKKTCALVRTLFYSKEHFFIFLSAYKTLEPVQKQMINNAIFIKKDKMELCKWFRKMGDSACYEGYHEVCITTTI